MKTSTVSGGLEATWRARVEAWRASGQPAADFVRDKDFAASTLQRWAYQLARARPTRFARVVPAPPAAPPGLVVEVGVARVRLAPGFDAALLAQVVAALAEAAR